MVLLVLKIVIQAWCPLLLTTHLSTFNSLFNEVEENYKKNVSHKLLSTLGLESSTNYTSLYNSSPHNKIEISPLNDFSRKST